MTFKRRPAAFMITSSSFLEPLVDLSRRVLEKRACGRKQHGHERHGAHGGGTAKGNCRQPAHAAAILSYRPGDAAADDGHRCKRTRHPPLQIGLISNER